MSFGKFVTNLIRCSPGAVVDRRQQIGSVRDGRAVLREHVAVDRLPQQRHLLAPPGRQRLHLARGSRAASRDCSGPRVIGTTQ